MAIEVRQSCEMCGKKRKLPMAARSSSTPSPDSGGWRLLNSGSREATLCNSCILLIVNHAQERAYAREENRPGKRNDRPLVLEFLDANKEDQ